MKVDLYERIWMAAAAVMIVAFVATIAYGAVGRSFHPPSHVETIDPKAVWQSPTFQPLGVVERPDGSIEVRVIAHMFAFQKPEIRVPAGKPVTFRLTSVDVLHGFLIVGTNANVMVVPGYVSQFTTVFDEPGEYLIVCNEYCGLSHHIMHAKLIVEAP
ncbi:MAG TPA: cytochrome c oxidase subunit II [Gemmatimonadota bacterium]|nr:cytochrome c oxidase subunit II [Gemmatimonadota bacterium]